MTIQMNKTVKIISVCFWAIFLTTGVALAQNTAGPKNSGVVCDLSDPYFYETYPDQMYDVSYARPVASNNISASKVTTASGPAKSGVICDLSDPYFRENYPDQM